MSCCEVCDRNPTCGNDCGSCHTDVCPECRLGVLHDGVATMANSCCAEYFLGWSREQWDAHVRYLAPFNPPPAVIRAEQIREGR